MEWQANFIFQGKSLLYNRISKNNRAERAIEIPIAFDFLANLQQGMRVLEVGNVLVNYENLAHEYKSCISRQVIDKYEIGEGIENIDLMDMPATHPDDLYDAIICISTVEHVGQGGYGSEIANRNLEAPLTAIAKIYQLLKIGGKALITTPCGKLLDGGWYVQSSPAYLDLLWSKYQIPPQAIKPIYLKRIGLEEIEFENPLQTWIEVERAEIEEVYYSFPWDYGNGLVVIELTKTADEFALHLDLPASDLFYYHPVDAVLNHPHLNTDSSVSIEIAAIISACQAVLKTIPNSAVAYQALGRANYMQGNSPAAKDYLLKAIELQNDLAIAHWQLGDIYYQEGQGEKAFSHKQTALTLKPDLISAEMHNRVGISLAKEGKPEEAIQSFQRAITLQPDYPLAFYNLGNAFSEVQDLDAAISAYRQAIAICTDVTEQANSTITNEESDISTLWLEAQLNLAAILTRQSQLEAAVVCYQQIIDTQPDCTEAYYHLGLILGQQNEVEDAMTCFLTVIEIQPDYVDAYLALGNLQFQQNHLSDAIACYRQALEIQPDQAEAYYCLGNAFAKQYQFKEAIHNFQIAIQHNQDHADAYNSLGGLLLHQDNCIEEATACFRKALAIKPDMAAAWGNLGAAFYSQGKLDEAIAANQQAIAIQPELPKPHLNLAGILLLRGDYENGLVGYEWRWQNDQYVRSHFDQPLWDGSNLEGKTILLWAEGGLGDTIHFIRYAPFVAERGGRVFVRCPASLVKLISCVEGLAQIFTEEEDLPNFDVHLPLMSLARVFGTTIKTIPNRVPYLVSGQQEDSGQRSAVSGQLEEEKAESRKLKADSPLKADSRKLIADSSLKIGIVWSGISVAHRPDLRTKACALASFVDLLVLPNITLYSLQLGDNTSAEMAKFSHVERLRDLSHLIHDFADTAALVDQLDLIISVDTSVAHLAGAMAKPTWVLLPFMPEWRWLLDRTDSPWYPTMRLFRQKQAGDWQDVFARVLKALQALA